MKNLVLVILTTVLLPSTCFAKFQPLYEVSLVTAGGSLPDYPGSEQHHFKYLVFPWGIYRGEFVRADAQGVQADLVKKTAVGVDVSISGSFPASSDDNRARVGMPDLDTMLELGPRFYYRMESREGTDLRAFLPFRAVVSTTFKSFTHRGWFISPGVTYRKPWGKHREKGSTFNYVVNFSDERMSQYFYEVAPQFTTPSRPQYAARGGYLGSTVSASIDFSRGSAKYLMGIAVQSYNGAANIDSPLHLKNLDYSAVIGIIWSVFKSKEPAFNSESSFVSSSSRIEATTIGTPAQ